jgi:hypothetical protein
MWPILHELHQSSHLQLFPHVYTTHQRWVLRLGLLLSWVFFVMMCIYAAAKGFNQTSIWEVSLENQTRSQPADYAYGIWILIFLSTGIFMGYFFVARMQTDSLHPLPAAAFVLNCISAGLWPLLFEYRWFIPALVDIFVTLITAIYLYMTFFPRGISAYPEKSLAYWGRSFPWSLYLGWMIVATLYHIHVVLVHYGIGTGPMSQDSGSIILLGVALLAGVILTLLHDDIIAVSALVWAFVAIAVQQSIHDRVFIAALCAAGAALALVVSTIIAFFMRDKGDNERQPI